METSFEQKRLVGSLPYDVLHYLFTSFFNYADDVVKVTLSSINRHWRRCAMASPGLWCNIKLYYCSASHSPTHGSSRSNNQFAFAALSRTRQAPLSFTIYAFRIPHPSEMTVFFLDNTHRINSIVLHTLKALEPQIWQAFRSKAIPRLAHVASFVKDQSFISYHPEKHTFSPLEWTSSFELTRGTHFPDGDPSITATDLTPFEFDLCHVYWGTLKSSSLTTLTLSALPCMPPTGDLYALLAGSSATLTYVKLWDFQPFLGSSSDDLHDDSVSAARPIILPALESLHIGYHSSGGSVFPYLQHLQTPKLREFVLRDIQICPLAPADGGRPYPPQSSTIVFLLQPTTHINAPPTSQAALLLSNNVCPDDGLVILRHFSSPQCATKLRRLSVSGLLCHFLNREPGSFMKVMQHSLEDLEFVRTGVELEAFQNACARDGLEFMKLQKMEISN